MQSFLEYEDLQEIVPKFRSSDQIWDDPEQIWDDPK